MKQPLPERYLDLSVIETAPKRFEFLAWQRNVIDEYKTLSNEEIKRKVEEKRLPYAILMTHINFDYNLGNVLRIGNCLGAKVFYYGKKRWDRRSSCGAQNYTPLHHLSSIEEVRKLKERYRFVALEQTDKSVPLPSYQWQKPSLIILGEESQGLQACPEIFDLADDFVMIEQRGSIRSLNASTACAIAAYDFVSKGKF